MLNVTVKKHSRDPIRYIVHETLKLAAMMMIKGNTMIRFSLPLGLRAMAELYGISGIN